MKMGGKLQHYRPRDTWQMKITRHFTTIYTIHCKQMKLTFIVHSLAESTCWQRFPQMSKKTNQSIFSLGLDGFIVSQFIQQITVRQAGLSNRHFFKTQITICCRRQILSFSSRWGLNHNVHKCIFIREKLDKVRMRMLSTSILSWGAFQLIYISHWLSVATSTSANLNFWRDHRILILRLGI